VAEPERLGRWFVFMLGTEPPQQQAGLGTALVEHGVRRAAEEGVPIHLDTGVQRNVKWFRRFGFEVADEVRLIPGAPPLWGMRTGVSALDAMVSECLHTH
jgi:predicted N-acetyltransferase YhbS